MITFKQRAVCPDGKNKAYLRTSYGGKNRCIEGNPKGRITEGCVLPNCTGYVHGRTIEVIGSDEMLCLGNAENYWGHKDGLPRSQTPMVGSIMVWRKGKAGESSDGAGHVAFVESVNSHGDVTVSESGWTGTKANGRYWRRRKLKRVNGTYSIGTDYRFMGFIHVYNPREITPVEGGIYRLYNPNGHQHMFTEKLAEANSLVRGGWTYERIGWRAEKNGNPVFRLYNPNTGDHVFTQRMQERLALEKYGWKYECVAFFSSGKTPIYRLYNKNSGDHMYTAAEEEKKALVANGWNYEGVAFYGKGF